MNLHGYRCDKKCYVKREVVFEYSCGTHRVKCYSCNDDTEVWSSLQEFVEKTFNLKLIQRKRLAYRGAYSQGFNADAHPALIVNGCVNRKSDLIDRASLTGFAKRLNRCDYCLRVTLRNHPDCVKRHRDSKRGEWIRYMEDHDSRVHDWRKAALQIKVVKLVKKLSTQMDERFNLREACKLLPYKPNMNGIRRLCLTGRIDAEKNGRDWVITGRSILLLLKQWIDTDRAPCQTRHSKRMMTRIR